MAEEAAIQAPQEVPKSAIFAVKTTANQERSVANMIAMVTRKEQLDIRSVLVPAKSGSTRQGASRCTVCRIGRIW